jgi:hypothetical protein
MLLNSAFAIPGVLPFNILYMSMLRNFVVTDLREPKLKEPFTQRAHTWQRGLR